MMLRHLKVCSGFPRTRGDGPLDHNVATSESLGFPRTRGDGPGSSVVSTSRDQVSPARAGMDPE